MPSIRSIAPVVALAGLLTLAGGAHAAGFAIIEQSASGLGNAFAGGAAAAEDATTIYFNPAGLTRLPEREVVGAGHVIVPSFEFSDGGSRAVTTVPLTGGDGGDGGVIKLVPNFYYTRSLTESTRFGLGVNAPFGLATEYDSDWKGRYQAIDSEIVTVNINPAIAHRFSERFSAAFGVNVQYLDARLTSAVDFAVACLGSPAAATCAADNLGLADVQTPGATGHLENTADDWAWGYNLGFLVEPEAGTRIGLAYRSKTDYELEGRGDFTLAPNVVSGTQLGAATLGAVFADSDITVDVTMPESLSLSVYHEMAPGWAVMGDITRTRWSRIPELRIDFANPLKSDGVEELNWEDTSRYSVGASYRYSDGVTLRAGLAYDETPVPDAKSRTARLPDNDRRWVAVGMSYRRGASLTFDFGYAYLFLSDAEIDRIGMLSDRLVGTYESEVDIVSAQARWLF